MPQTSGLIVALVQGKRMKTDTSLETAPRIKQKRHSGFTTCMCMHISGHEIFVAGPFA